VQRRQLQLSLLKDLYGICKFPSDSSIPEWALDESLCSITRSKKELTVVCPQGIIPANTEYDSDWRCFRIDGSFDFNQIGVISSLAEPLAEAGVSIFVISTYDTDYILVKEEKVEQAVNVLTDNGHLVSRED
jgi:hypothetical protein